MSTITLLILVLTTTFLTVTTSMPYPDWENVDNLRHPYSNDDILVVKTNSTLGSDDRVAIRFEPTKAGASNRQIYLYFTSTIMQYTINACTRYYTNIVSSVPAALDKVWTIRKNEERILITCNGEEIILLYYVEGLSACSETWSRNENEVRFLTTDSASDQFRILLGSATYFEPPTLTLGKLEALLGTGFVLCFHSCFHTCFNFVLCQIETVGLDWDNSDILHCLNT